MVTLYEHPLSPYAQKVKIALREKGIAFTAQLPNFFGADEVFTATNPRLEVPALIDGDTRVFDSTIILEYLEDKWPAPPLLPKAPGDRARARMLEELADTYYEAIPWAIMEIRIFGRATGELADRLLARAAEQLTGANAYLDRQLAGRPWFNGERFGWGDLALAPLVHSAAGAGTPPRAGSDLERWLDRVRAQPSVTPTFEEAAAAMTGFEMLPQLVASGQFKREYRDHRLEWMLRSGGVEIVIEGLRRGTIRFSHELA